MALEFPLGGGLWGVDGDEGVVVEQLLVPAVSGELYGV